MAHKTFISYKYSESRHYRDIILSALGNDAIYYKGETSESPDLTDYTTDTIKHHLKEMIYDTSVTIIIVSPHMKESDWMNWEICYSLKTISRDGRASHTNGLLGIIPPFNGDYSWFVTHNQHSDNHITTDFNEEYTFPIMKKNRFNQNPTIYACPNCRSVNSLTGSYLSYITLEEFTKNSSFYIDNAFEKSLHADGQYRLVKEL